MRYRPSKTSPTCGRFEPVDTGPADGRSSTPEVRTHTVLPKKVLAPKYPARANIIAAATQ
jgi:hypothetical protein